MHNIHILPMPRSQNRERPLYVVDVLSILFLFLAATYNFVVLVQTLMSNKSIPKASISGSAIQCG